MSINPIDHLKQKPTISQQSVIIDQDLSLNYRHDLPGELVAPQGFDRHLLTIFMSQNQRQVTHFDAYGEYDGTMAQGDFYLYPSALSGFTHWFAIDKTLHFEIKPNLLHTTALETECLNPQKVELLPILKAHDPQIEYLAKLFVLETQNNYVAQKSYLESLSDVLILHLLRNYCAFKPVFREYSNGLASAKLRQTIDYIHAYLDRDLSLAVMAEQLNMSRCYFASQFKQAMGIAPHQYIVRQRIEKAQQLLKKSERSLLKIALDCGFANQSHFNKVFRQHIGTTPRKYRDKL